MSDEDDIPRALGQGGVRAMKLGLVDISDELATGGEAGGLARNLSEWAAGATRRHDCNQNGQRIGNFVAAVAHLQRVAPEVAERIAGHIAEVTRMLTVFIEDGDAYDAYLDDDGYHVVLPTTDRDAHCFD